jgi:hypothetical protein
MSSPQRNALRELQIHYRSQNWEEDVENHIQIPVFETRPEDERGTSPPCPRIDPIISNLPSRDLDCNGCMRKVPRKFTCPYTFCDGMSFTRYVNLANHMETQHEGEWCGEVFLSCLNITVDK